MVLEENPSRLPSGHLECDCKKKKKRVQQQSHAQVQSDANERETLAQLPLRCCKSTSLKLSYDMSFIRTAHVPSSGLPCLSSFLADASVEDSLPDSSSFGEGKEKSDESACTNFGPKLNATLAAGSTLPCVKSETVGLKPLRVLGSR